MGFGLLFLGYFMTFLMSMNPFGVIFRLIGWVIICRGACKLTAYNEYFVPVKYSAVAMILLSFLDSGYQLFSYMYDNLLISFNVSSELMSNVILYTQAAGMLVFNLVLYVAARKIAADTGVQKIVVASWRNTVCILLYYVLYIIGRIPAPFVAEYNKIMGLPIVVLYILWIIFGLTLLASCYAHICDESDVEMERKPSRFEFVNKIRTELDEKEKRARAADAQYKIERAERRKNKRK